MSLRRWNKLISTYPNLSIHRSPLTTRRTLKVISYPSHSASTIGISTGLKLPLRLISTNLSHPLQVRQISFISAAARAAGKVGGRLVGVGAVGVGSAAYVGSQVDGLKNNIFGVINGLSDSLESITDSTSRTISDLSESASDVFTSLSDSLESNLSSISNGFQEFWSRSEGDQEEENGKPEGDPIDPLLLSAAALSYGATTDDNNNLNMSINDPGTGGLMQLTRKLIEIRSLLMSIDQDETLVLPSIVVIGSQSSGKSSVLEAIVGHEFLPKGNNMVTRRPLELTLIHTPPTTKNPSPEEYTECVEFGPGRFSDFSEVQQRLTRLNQAVPDTIAVSEQPIYLKVYSPHVPDLTLVDLPGYVQVSSMDQPEELREKIQSLCEKYLRKPNLILSVCAADVDLANSPALRASRRVDPHGYRSIGVVTKMDLVDPKIGASILSNEKYRLPLGYVGVICKASKNGLLTRGGSSQVNHLAEQEHVYFRSHPEAYGEPNLLLGTITLKQRLMKLLEESMSSSLHDISNRVSLELEEATYQYKVQYNDRHISAETYVSETIDSLKRRLIEFSKCLSKAQVRGMLKEELDQKVLGLLAELYWSDRRIPELGKLADSSRVPMEGIEPHWVQRLQAVQSRLTKGGIGRCASDLVADEIRFAITKILEQEPIGYHPNAKSEILSITEDILDGLRSRAADHVEIAVMPYRYELEISKAEWESSRIASMKLMEEEMKMCDEFLRTEKSEVRRNWRLREALEHVKEDEERMRRKAQRWILDGGIHASTTMTGSGLKGLESEEVVEVEVEETRPPPVLLDRARRLRDMEGRAEILRLRNQIIKSRRCKLGPNSQSICPEIFLNVLADRLSKTSTDFIKIDLLSRFFSTVPHEINSRLVKALEGDLAVEFARENPEVKRHLELQDRKEKLERVMRELVTLTYMKEENENGVMMNSIHLGGGGNLRRSGSKTSRSSNYFSNFF